MKLFGKPRDPLTSRARHLNDEIARLQAEIRELSSRQATAPAAPRYRSTASRGPSAEPQRVEIAYTAPRPAPIFGAAATPPPPASASPGNHDRRYNELGIRKYDLVAAWQRLTSHLRGTTSDNPRMVSFLAAGSIQGLRPLRFERRVARRRFLALLVLLILILWGVTYVYLRQ
jgi:hypothetical protein